MRAVLQGHSIYCKNLLYPTQTQHYTCPLCPILGQLLVIEKKKKSNCTKRRERIRNKDCSPDDKCNIFLLLQLSQHRNALFKKQYNNVTR